MDSTNKYTKPEYKHSKVSQLHDEEYPSLLEPLQKKEKKLGVASADLIPLKIKLINFYFGKGDVNNVYKYLKNVIELIPSSNDDDLPLSNYLEQLSGPATVVDQNISGAGMVDRLDEIAPLKINRKAGAFNPVVISIKTTDQVLLRKRQSRQF